MQRVCLWLLKLTVLLISSCCGMGVSNAAEPAPAKLVNAIFQTEAKVELSIEACVLVKTGDGGVLIEGRDGRIWAITPDRLKQLDEQPGDFQLFTAEELAAALTSELKANGVVGPFETITTPHYVVVTNTSRVYAEWCSQVLERLFAAFSEFWKPHGIELTPPLQPLPVIVLANQTQFANFAKVDGNQLSAKGQGYYSITTNRIVLFDLTTSKGQPIVRSRDEVLKRLRLVSVNVATVVHEATHQISFNTGLNRRYADNPIWLTEGLAMHFEAADFLDDEVEIGRLNAVRLKRWRDAQRAKRTKPVTTILRDNKRFGQADSAIDAYAESWALTYFLLKTRPADFADYCGRIADKPLLQLDEADQRQQDFEAAFGDVSKLDPELRQFLQKLPAK